MPTFSKPHITPAKLLLLFVLGWVALNLIQAASIGVDADEAYYWLYAQHLQWGYFDHPPLVALSIKLGETFGHGPFYTRLVTALLSGATVYFGFLALPRAVQHVKWYLLLFSSVVLFHVYGFIATPDAALLFFTTLFFYAYRLYLEKETITRTLLLALCIVGLLYSKYHGVLPLFFTVLSNPRLLLKRTAWLAVLIAVVAFGPHLWWQYGHDWPTFRYHLFERIASSYTISKTLNYIIGQLFIWGPLTTIPAFFRFVTKRHVYTVYARAHLFTFWGVLLFFLLSSFRSTIEPHWTLVAGPSFIVLLLVSLHEASATTKKRVALLCAITSCLILISRLFFILPGAPLKKFKAFNDLVYAKNWTGTLYHFAQGEPVVFMDSYRLPALYQYYHPDAKTSGYNTVRYRKTQYNFYNDAAFNNKAVYIAGTNRWSGVTNFFKTPYDTIFLQKLPAYKAINTLKIIWQQPLATLNHVTNQTFVITLYNSGIDTIAASGLSINYTFLKTRNNQYTPPTAIALQEKFLAPGFKKEIAIPLFAPEERGTYKLIFSIVQPPMAGSFASPFYNVAIK